QKVSLNQVEEYMDLLYEHDYEKKVLGVRNMLFLLKNPENIFHLQKAEDLLSNLSRTLKEEYKKNMELSIHILAFFYTYSCYEDFQNVLLSNEIGSTCIEVIEFHIAKYI